MNRYERWNILLDMLHASGRLEIHSAAEQLGMSAATIRRDFDELAAQQLVTRTRGGVAANSVSYDLPLRYKGARHAPEKQRIAAVAAAMIVRGATVGMNGGTTTTEVARALAARADLSIDQVPPAVTVVTNALNIANELVIRPHIRVVASGGVARTQSYELMGPIAVDVLSAVALDIAFLGVDGIDDRHGASTHNDAEAAVNHVLASQADRVVVVADGSKLGRRAFARICTITEIDRLITDTDAPEDAVSRLREAGLTVEVV